MQEVITHMVEYISLFWSLAVNTLDLSSFFSYQPCSVVNHKSLEVVATFNAPCPCYIFMSPSYGCYSVKNYAMELSTMCPTKHCLVNIFGMSGCEKPIFLWLQFYLKSKETWKKGAIRVFHSPFKFQPPCSRIRNINPESVQIRLKAAVGRFVGNRLAMNSRNYLPLLTAE